ncbi:MAG: ribosome silencing factor [Myxococcota bacterium]|nr:ribosome silencing factor [Myxococcota bacterium]
MEAKELALSIAEIALDKQAESIEIIDVSKKVDYTHYLVICSGGSERHVEALVSAVERTLKQKGVFALGVEGREASQWILMDFDDVIFHVFEQHRRGFYDLDSLWIDAERVPLRQASVLSKGVASAISPS